MAASDIAFGGAPFVKVTNTGDTVFKDGYANVTYVIEPGASQFVPGEAALLWFGDNGLFDIDARNRPREAERKRLRIKYGIYNDHDTWDARTPSVRVEDLEGNRLYTLIEDPDGTLSTDEDATSNTTGDVITDRLAQLERELTTLRQALASQESATEAERRGSAETDGGEEGGEEGGDENTPAAGETAAAPDLTASNPSDSKTSTDKAGPGGTTSPEPRLLDGGNVQPAPTGAKKDGPTTPPVKR